MKTDAANPVFNEILKTRYTCNLTRAFREARKTPLAQTSKLVHFVHSMSPKTGSSRERERVYYINFSLFNVGCSICKVVGKRGKKSTHLPNTCTLNAPSVVARSEWDHAKDAQWRSFKTRWNKKMTDRRSSEKRGKGSGKRSEKNVW